MPRDPCWAAAKSMLGAPTLRELELEARSWRRDLGKSLEKYHNEQQAAWYSRYPSARARVNARFNNDWHPRPRQTGNRSRDLDLLSASYQEAYTRERFSLFLPKGVAEAARARSLCRRQILLGDEANFRASIDGYHACGVDEAASGAGGCIVYSLGSNNVFHFEDAVVAKTNCTVHTFDCTSHPPRGALAAHPRFHFHPTCVGQSRAVAERSFKPLSVIMAELGHAHVSIIKWDVEGFEHDIFREALQDEKLHARLPREILFELHYRSHMRARTGWWDREKTAGEMAVLGLDLYHAGYRVISAHANSGCPSCYEYSLLRVTCPEVPQGRARRE